METKSIRRVFFGDMEAVYLLEEDGTVGFCLIPVNCPRAAFDKGKTDPLVQISCTGDASCPGFTAGETRHNSALTESLKFVSQEESYEGKDGMEKCLVTVLENREGLRARHIVTGRADSRCIRLRTEVINGTGKEIMIEALSSFDLSGLTPFAADRAGGRLLLHRFRSRWSAEGRHETQRLEDLLLEPSWSGHGVRCEKFGAVGSMPVRGFFPVIGLEDTGAGITWGITNACASSWQIEAVRYDDNLCLAGGLADYDFGHWRKCLKPGQSFTTPEAYLTVAVGDMDLVCDRMLDAQRERLLPRQRKSFLPVLYNEYCASWGRPCDENIEASLRKIRGETFDRFVIDAGWYADPEKGWQDNMGDWTVSRELFAGGLKPVVQKIGEAGMKAGIWFELEVVGKDADARKREEYLLTRDGKVIVSGTRRFWDMRKPWVKDYLTEKVIEFLDKNGFGYIKIDYNESIGIGCDGAESYGEGLRQCLEATKEFFGEIRESLPDIEIEICASGGHRLEPSFMELADYLSFSDAHEEKEIPVIAADLQRLVLPSKSQIWAVVRKTDSQRRIAYSLTAAMYGVLCISGDAAALNSDQWELVQRGAGFYRRVSPVIISGYTKRFGPTQRSNRDLRDYQVGVRYGENECALVIAHSFSHDFEGEGKLEIEIPLDGVYEIEEIFETGSHNVRTAGSGIRLCFEEAYDGLAVLLRRLITV